MTTGIKGQDGHKTDKIIEELTNNKKVERIYLFDSYVKNKIKSFSDIDIYVITEKNVLKEVKE